MGCRTRFWTRCWTAAALGALVLSAVPATARSTAGAGNDLLVAYSLLAESLDAESHVQYLLWLREATLNGPGKGVERLMTSIYEASGKRSRELARLRELPPAATAKPPPSPIGDAIQSAAQWAGTKEMLFPDGEFSMRFVVLQAQATRMLTVIAEQAAKIDPNPERRKWLEEVSRQYAAFREELLKAIDGCKPQ